LEGGVSQDMLEWSKKRLGELLGAITLVSDSCVEVKTTGVSSVTGEANLYQRKKKLIPHYELEIKVRVCSRVVSPSIATLPSVVNCHLFFRFPVF
jgi:activator of HSP90 ATPase